MQTALEVRKTGDARWQVIHLPTGLPIGYKNSRSYGKNRKKDVIAFMEYLSIFPWHEWTDVDIKPAWDDAAWRHIQNYGQPIMKNLFPDFAA